MGDLYFEYVTITAQGRDWQVCKDSLLHQGTALLQAQGGKIAGFWAPQFGWASNQCVLLVSWTDEAAAKAGKTDPLAGLVGVDAVESLPLVSTVRPTESDLALAAGSYVHRWFTLPPGDVAELVALSAAAWKTFEVSYAARVVGLFRAPDEAGVARLLLLNWYPSLAAWESSREVPKDRAAWDGFARRRKLLHDSKASSTILVTDGETNKK